MGLDIDHASEPLLEEDEEREVGAVSWKVYTEYIRATGSWFWVSASAMFLLLTQLVNLANSLFLGWWSSDEFGMEENLYMAVYAGEGGDTGARLIVGLGVGIALFTVRRRGV